MLECRLRRRSTAAVTLLLLLLAEVKAVEVRPDRHQVSQGGGTSGDRNHLVSWRGGVSAVRGVWEGRVALNCSFQSVSGRGWDRGTLNCS